ncbi:DUF6069 family protein [Kitasatospora sp. NPDC090091]|uniref:DUF6069 family protein n=1 Tax=Kitasatospora sp. NPDC090091 TaxID=3364081 RepID=UPI0037FB5EA1
MATTPSAPPRPSAHSPARDPGRLLRPAAVCAGLLANLLYLLVLTDVAGYDLQTPALFGRPAQSVSIALAAASSVVPALLGWGLLELLERHLPRRATAVWTALAVLLLVGGLPYSGAGVTTADRLLLALMHLIVGAAVIPAFVVTSLRRS